MLETAGLGASDFVLFDGSPTSSHSLNGVRGSWNVKAVA